MTNGDKFSASEPGLGYIYQPRLALLKILELPEDSAVYIEGNDDLEFLDNNGRITLSSLKHKAVGGRLTDLATDFWKSVRIWLQRYNESGQVLSDFRFFLYSTDTVAENSFLRHFLSGATAAPEPLSILATTIMEKSSSKIVIEVMAIFELLNEDQKEDFLSRITIFDQSPRITDVPVQIMDRHLRTVRRTSRQHVFERLEGWWHDATIKLLSGETLEPIHGYEVSDKLSAIAEEYQSDNLPITFRNKQPEGGVDADGDPRLFVQQLRLLGISTSRIQSAIIDYFRAFEQRSSWARENLLVSGEIEEYEDRLVDEWARFKDVVFEKLDENDESSLREAGKQLFNWAQFETESLRIRERVTEPYVVRGAFHILANSRPIPRVHWHPKFLERIEQVLGVAS